MTSPLSTTQAAAVRMVLVPLELTPAMIAADPYGMGYGRLAAIWSRLIAAAPQAHGTWVPADPTQSMLAASPQAKPASLTDEQVSAEVLRWNLPGNDAALEFHKLSAHAQVRQAFVDGLRRGIVLAANSSGSAVEPLACRMVAMLKPNDLTTMAALLDEAAGHLRAFMETELAEERQMRHFLPDELEGSAIMMRDTLAATPPSAEAVRVCHETYAAIGGYLHDLAEAGHPQAEKLWENLAEARLVHEDVLPFAAPPSDARDAARTIRLVEGPPRDIGQGLDAYGEHKDRP